MYDVVEYLSCQVYAIDASDIALQVIVTDPIFHLYKLHLVLV